MVALLDRIHTSDEATDAGEKLDYQTLRGDMGTVDAEFFARNAFVEFLPEDDQRWLDLHDPRVIEELRRRLAPWLRDAGCEDFDFSDLVTRERQVTQHIASLALDAGIHGVIYLSRMHPGARCWALFEKTAIRRDAVVSHLGPEDPDYERVQQGFGLQLAPDVRAAKRFLPRPMPTGGIVRGDD